jgi:3'-phosphoadenosine 5'-phosphosulfate sulfotransferase (PAPS reductase)/FAD synthetase
MKIIVQFSGGKDSQACLLWAIENYPEDEVIAVFCDTQWEHAATYEHVESECKDLGVPLINLKSKKYDGMLDLAIKKRRFPSRKAQFCTQELKINPFVDWILDEHKTHCMIIQGVRRDESDARKNALQECEYFKFWKHSYGNDKNGKPKYMTYRRKEVLAHYDKYACDINRPVIDWTAQQVIDYILSKGRKPNELYYSGSARVGCYPCINASHAEVLQMAERHPEYIERIADAEKQVGRTFFSRNYIPDYACSSIDIASRKRVSFIWDVVRYLKENPDQTTLFEKEPILACSSLYHLCE